MAHYQTICVERESNVRIDRYTIFFIWTILFEGGTCSQTSGQTNRADVEINRLEANVREHRQCFGLWYGGYIQSMDWTTGLKGDGGYALTATCYYARIVNGKGSLGHLEPVLISGSNNPV